MLFSALFLEDSGNYTCEIRGPDTSVIATLEHRLFVRGIDNKKNDDDDDANNKNIDNNNVNYFFYLFRLACHFNYFKLSKLRRVVQ